MSKKNKRGLYLIRYNTTNTIYFNIDKHKIVDNCHKYSKVGFKIGRTSNIEKRLEYYKKVKGIEYNLIKFYPCNNEKLRETMLKGDIAFNEHFRETRSEHLPKEYWLTTKDITNLLDHYANGKLIKDYKCLYNHYIKV